MPVGRADHHRPGAEWMHLYKSNHNATLKTSARLKLRYLDHGFPGRSPISCADTLHNPDEWLPSASTVDFEQFGCYCERVQVFRETSAIL